MRSVPLVVMMAVALAGGLAGCNRRASDLQASRQARAAHRASIAAASAVPTRNARPYSGPLVDLRGGPEQIGLQHGRQFGQQIRLLHDQYLAKYIGTGAHRFIALSTAGLFESYFPAAYLAETQALSRETGMDERESVLAQCFLDLSPMVACSTVTLPASAAPDHVARFGRNLDFTSFNVADKYSAVFIYHPEGRYQFASIGWPGMVGVLSGMNEHGLALANMEVTRSARLPGAMPYTLLYRSILEQCRTVSEAIDLLQKTPRQTANNLMLMDASGDRAVVEITPQSVAVRRAPADQALISTNHQRGADCDTAGRCWRYDYLHESAGGGFGHIDLAMLESMLAGASPGKKTLQSMVFEPANLVIYLSTGARAASGTFYRLELKPRFAQPPRSQIVRSGP